MKPAERLRALASRTVLGGLGLWERLESGVSYNLASADFLEAPHPVYRALREDDPVHRSRLVRGWVFTRYDDVQTLL